MATTAESLRYQADTPMAIAKVLRAYLLEAKYATLHALRTPAMAIPFLVLPPAMYLLFGVMIVPEEPQSELGPGIVNYIFSGFCAVAVMMPGIFSGVNLAIERDGGLLKLKRALPMPGGADLIAKMAMSLVFAAAAVGFVVVAALVAGRITLSTGQLLMLAATMVVGTIPFCALGFFIGSVSSGNAAPAYANLLFLPMIWLSGLFIPLPDSLERWIPIWPAFHLNQLALGVAGVHEFSFISPQLAAGVLAGVTVLFGGLAIWRFSRIG